MIAELERVKASWKEVKDFLSIPHSKKEYNKIVSLLDLVIDEVGNKENHPLAPLLEVLGSLVESYEEENFNCAIRALTLYLAGAAVYHKVEYFIVDFSN